MTEIITGPNKLLRTGLRPHSSVVDRRVVDQLFMVFGERINVPHKYLWGTCHPDQFRNDAERRVKRELRKWGRSFLLANPLEVVFVPGRGAFCAIDNGHHRARFAPPFVEDRIMPCTVLDVSNYANLLKRDQEEILMEFLLDVSTTTASFLDKLAGDKSKNVKPQNLPGNPKTVRELREVLRSEV